MLVSRRTMLGALGGLAAAPLSGCRGVPAAFRPPPTIIPSHPVRLAVVVSQNLTDAALTNYQHQYQQVVDAAAGKGVAVDKTITWIPGTLRGQSGYAAGMSAFQNIETAYMGVAAAGTPSPDLLLLAGGPSQIYTPWLLQQLVGGQLVRPLDAELGRDRMANLHDYFPHALDTCRLSGKLYGLPTAIIPYLLLTDPTLLRAEQLASADTWDWNHLLDAASRLTKAPNQYAFAPPNFPSLELFLWQHGASVLGADGTRCTLDDPAAIEAAAFYGDLFTLYKVIAPPGKDTSEWPIKPDGRMTYNGARIALLMTGGLGPTKPLQFSEPFHDSARATSLVVQDMLVMTVRAADPARSYAVLAALAAEMQGQNVLPPRHSLAKAMPLPEGVDQPAFTVMLNAAEYARASQVYPGISAPFYNTLQMPLQQGTKTAEDACKAAADAINAILQGHAGTPGPA
ncbi:MAG: extracellular solute-binding protein [Chloroflexota bacterium]